MDQVVHSPAVKGVIHVVIDTIQPSRVRTTVLTGGASRGRCALKRSIGNGVSGARAGRALENMEETEPMADLMGCRATLVVIGGCTSGNRLGKDVAAVLFIGGAPWRCVCREVANPEEAATEVGQEVDVEVGVGALAQGGLHLRVVITGGPVVVHGEVGANEREGDARRSIASVDDCKLYNY